MADVGSQGGMGIAFQVGAYYCTFRTIQRLQNPQLNLGQWVKWLEYIPWVWYVVSIVAWIVLVYYQSLYVPLLHQDSLSECSHGADRQCNMVSGTWIMGILSW